MLGLMLSCQELLKTFDFIQVFHVIMQELLLKQLARVNDFSEENESE